MKKDMLEIQRQKDKLLEDHKKANEEIRKEQVRQLNRVLKEAEGKKIDQREERTEEGKRLDALYKEMDKLLAQDRKEDGKRVDRLYKEMDDKVNQERKERERVVADERKRADKIIGDEKKDVNSLLKELMASKERVAQLEANNKRLENELTEVTRLYRDADKKATDWMNKTHALEVEHGVHDEMNNYREKIEHALLENQRLKESQHAEGKEAEFRALQKMYDALKTEYDRTVKKMEDLEAHAHALAVKEGVHEEMARIKKENAQLKKLETVDSDRYKNLMQEYNALQSKYFKEQDDWRKETYELRLRAEVNEKWKNETKPLKEEMRQRDTRLIAQLKEALVLVSKELGQMTDEISTVKRTVEDTVDKGFGDTRDLLRVQNDTVGKKLKKANDVMNRSLEKTMRNLPTTPGRGHVFETVDSRGNRQYRRVVGTEPRRGAASDDEGGYISSASAPSRGRAHLAYRRGTLGAGGGHMDEEDGDLSVNALADMLKNSNLYGIKTKVHFLNCNECSDFIMTVTNELKERGHIAVAACDFHYNQLLDLEQFRRVTVDFPDLVRTFHVYDLQGRKLE
jgi:tetrahydromethanopterin S-methyltransferase subunit B